MLFSFFLTQYWLTDLFRRISERVLLSSEIRWQCCLSSLRFRGIYSCIIHRLEHSGCSDVTWWLALYQGTTFE